MSSAAAPASHLPGRLSSLSDVSRVEPVIQEINDLIVRLKVQAFVIIIHDLFLSLDDLKELTVNGDDDSRPRFTGFEGAEEFAADLREATDQVDRLDIPSDSFVAFETQQPFMRDCLEEQLAAAYEGALTASQRQRGGVWNTFWRDLPPIESALDEEEPDPENDQPF